MFLHINDLHLARDDHDHQPGGGWLGLALLSTPCAESPKAILPHFYRYINQRKIQLFKGRERVKILPFMISEYTVIFPL